MKMRFAISALFVTLFSIAVVGGAPSTLQLQNEQLFQQMSSTLGLSEEQLARIRSIFARSGRMGQGNPAITVHPVSQSQCLARLEREGKSYNNPRFEKICGSKYMAPLYDPATQKPEDARVCIDQFEFPSIPCTYPVVWTRASEAAEVCEAQGKRMCDAHEWEGACAGSLQPPDYDFASVRGLDGHSAFNRLRAAHNRRTSASQSWSYGPAYRKGVCGANSFKSGGCGGGEWGGCGSNTYPSGEFHDCHSALGVYDINGNAAEHMNLPVNEEQMSSRGSKSLGHTEMKGSWFIWDKIRAHEDWCRWRAPYWHGSRVKDSGSHANYHLGFRCCKSLDAK